MTRTIRRAPARLLGLAAAALVVSAALAGCAEGGSSAPSTSKAADLIGTWGSTAAQQPSLTIKKGGAFSGSDGCNELTGKGTIDGDTITFGAISSTLEVCEGVDTWLKDASYAYAAGTTMNVYNNGGEKIGKLAKAK